MSILFVTSKGCFTGVGSNFKIVWRIDSAAFIFAYIPDERSIFNAVGNSTPGVKRTAFVFRGIPFEVRILDNFNSSAVSDSAAVGSGVVNKRRAGDAVGYISLVINGTAAA